ncbi:MAG: hypothetical protein EOS50_26060 [Mesorhizobium sp.]|nr:MAG: hypothetical protein EOS50_26060 [Mesorhizobium sp.]
MSDVRQISVAPKPRLSRSILGHTAFWCFLVGATGISRLWFGGAWTIDVIVLLLALLGGYTIATVSGAVVNMFKGETADWVKAGMPDDIKAWRICRRAKLA